MSNANASIARPVAVAKPGAKLLNPHDHTLIMIDFQSQMAFATHSIDPVQLRSNAALVASAAAGFGASTILTTVAEKSFSGPMFEEVTAPFPGQALLDRTSMNTWEDQAVINKVNEIGKPRIVLAGLWTSVCIVGPALSALDQGFEVFVIADACATSPPKRTTAPWIAWCRPAPSPSRRCNTCWKCSATGPAPKPMT